MCRSPWDKYSRKRYLQVSIMLSLIEARVSSCRRVILPWIEQKFTIHNNHVQRHAAAVERSKVLQVAWIWKVFWLHSVVVLLSSSCPWLSTCIDELCPELGHRMNANERSSLHTHLTQGMDFMCNNICIKFPLVFIGLMWLSCYHRCCAHPKQVFLIALIGLVYKGEMFEKSVALEVLLIGSMMAAFCFPFAIMLMAWTTRIQHTSMWLRTSTMLQTTPRQHSRRMQHGSMKKQKEVCVYSLM